MSDSRLLAAANGWVILEGVPYVCQVWVNMCHDMGYALNLTSTYKMHTTEQCRDRLFLQVPWNVRMVKIYCSSEERRSVRWLINQQYLGLSLLTKIAITAAPNAIVYRAPDIVLTWQWSCTNVYDETPEQYGVSDWSSKDSPESGAPSVTPDWG